MSKNDPDQPPLGAIPLREALESLVDPSLSEALRQARERLAAAEATVGGAPFGPGYSVYNEEAVIEAFGEAAVAAVHAARETLARTTDAVYADLVARGRSGECTAWGRVGSSLKSLQRLAADVWPYVKFGHGDVLEVPGTPPVRLYGVVVIGPSPAVAPARTCRWRRRRRAR